MESETPDSSGRSAGGRRRWRWLAVVVVFIAALLVAGAVYQAVGAARDAGRYPAPGQRVDVGGYAMHIYCVGAGSPTVILDHIGDGNMGEWALIQPVVAEETRVCAYDRAGFGWSDPGPLPRDAQQSARELDLLLTNAAVSGPYVLVGHSYGANVARVYAAQYPDDLAALVLVDPGYLHDRPGVPEDVNEQWKREGRFIIGAAPWLTRIGFMRLGAAAGALGYGELPAAQGEAFVAVQLTPKYGRAVADQYAAFEDTSAQVFAAEKALPPVPLLVLSATEPGGDPSRRTWTEVNARIAELVPEGEHRAVSGASHMSLVLSREHAAIVSQAILEMVERVRAR